MNKIRIGYANYNIVDETKKKLDGEFAHRKKELRISPHLDSEGKLNTIIHEVLHGVWFHWGLTEAIDGKNSEETAVNALANGLTQVIRDNPDFLNTLVELAENCNNDYSWEEAWKQS